MKCSPWLPIAVDDSAMALEGHSICCHRQLPRSVKAEEEEEEEEDNLLGY